MSRSRKKIPIRGITGADTEKTEKRLANRKFRHITKIQVKLGKDISAVRELSNVWAFSKDGKIFIKNPTAKSLRK